MTLPNVVGTALGQKRSASKLTGDRSVVVLVDRKVPKQRIKRSQRIPAELGDRNKHVLTDVVSIHSLARQIASPPYYCFDGVQQGTVTAFAKTNSQFFALTCAHCLTGIDGDPYTADPISLYCPNSEEYVQVGNSAYVFQGPGHGTPGDFGFADVGLFSILNDEFTSKADNGNSMEIREQIRVNDHVRAASSHGEVTGTIDMVEGVFANLFADFVVKVDGAGTFGGDSGMLWRSTSNSGVGIHTYGSVETPGTGSQYSVAMSAKRAVNFMQVDFIDPA